MPHQRSSLHLAALEHAEVLRQKLAEIEAACLSLEPTDPTSKALLHQALKEAQAAQASFQQQLRVLNHSERATTQELADSNNSNNSDTGYPSTKITGKSPETSFWQLFEESQDPAFIVEDGIFIDCNRAAIKAMHCANKSELLSLNPVALSPEFQPDGRSSAEKANEMIEMALRQGNHRFEWMHRRINGEGFWVEIQLTSLTMQGRQILYATLRDIGDRKAAEAELYEQEQLLRSTYEGMECNIVIIEVSVDGELRYIGWNPATEKQTGLASEFVVGKTPEEALGSVTGAIVRKNYQRCLSLGKSITYEEYLPFQGCDTWWLTTLNPLKNERGRFYRIVLTTFDITDRKIAEAKLQQKETQYRSIFEAMNDGILISDLETGELVTANPAACKLFGYTYEEFMQLQPPDYVHAQSLPLFTQFLETLRAGKRFGCEAVDIRKDGTLIDVEVTGVSLLYDGKPHALTVVRNIGDRKAAENALQETNTLLNSLLETIPGFFFVKDREGRHVAVNSNLADFFGRPINEVIGKTDADLLPANVAAAIMVKDQEVMIQGITQRFEEIVPKRGVDHTYLTVKTPFYDAQGKIIGLLGLAQDISDRKAMEVSLRQSEQRFRDVTEAAGEYIWEISADGQYTFVTERVTAVKGYSPAELLGHSPFEFMPQADIDHTASIIQRATVDKSAFSLEHRDILPSGDVVWESVTGLPILDEQGEIIGFRGTGLSITERKVAETDLTQKAEELEQTLQELQRAQLRMIQNEKMSSLGQLVAGVAHEINNPVSFIYSNIPPANQYTRDLLHLINLYQTHYPDPLPRIRDEMMAIDLEFIKQDLPKILGSMKLGAERIRQIIGSLRTFSRLDEADCKEVDIHAGLDSTLVILGHRIKATPERPMIQIIKDYGELGLVECYAGQLNQVFMNILANALDALEDRDRHRNPQDMQQSPSTITIRTNAIGSDRIAIHILDNGPGMPELVQQRVFDPFFTTKPVGQGTGMGMSISHQIITENHGGKIQCLSVPGEETEFIIEIPQRQSRA